MRATSADVRLRPQATGDQPLLLQLFGQSRAAEFAAMGWSQQQLESFVYAQFKQQSLDYARRFPAARFDVIEVDAQTVGRFYVARQGPRYTLIDITIAEDWRGKGIATHLIRDLQHEAAGVDGEILLHVRTDSPARKLYTRLGFETRADDGTEMEMHWARRDEPACG